MANRFWGGGSSSSDDSESEPSEESISSNEEASDGDDNNQRYFGSSSSGDDKRVMKSKKDKATEALNLVVHALSKSLAANDWLGITEQWDKLLKQDKPLRQALPSLPISFVRSLVKVDDAIKAMTKDQIQKLDGNHRRAFTRMQNGVKKQIATYADLMAAYREKPEEDQEGSASQSEDAASSDEDGQDTPASTVKSNKPTKKPVKHSWFKKDSGSDSGSETDSESESESADDTKPKKPRDKQKKVAQEINWTPELVDEKITYYLSRSKKARADKKNVVSQLRFLKSKAVNNLQRLKIYAGLLTHIFDKYTPVDSILPPGLWNECMYYTKTVIDLLDSAPELNDRVVYESAVGVPSTEEDAVSGAQRILAFAEKLGDSLLRSFQETDPHSLRYLNLLRNESRYNSLCIQVQAYYEKRRLYDSLSRIIIRHMDLLYYKRDEYDTAPLPITEPVESSGAVGLGATPSNLASDEDEADDLSETPTPSSQSTPARPADEVRELPVEPGTPSISERLRVLAAIIYKHGTPALRTQALLMDAYHHALHDRYDEGRNMLLMSHLQDTIGNMDISIQILFNRAMVQLGLAAFRQGKIPEAHSCLMELYSSMRPNHKELLAQGLSKVRFGMERPPEKESLEKRRQIPYHKHISFDVVECVHLIAALLLEVPYLAAHQYAVKHRSLSRTFSRLLGMSERQLWGVGPAESSRDHIIAATRKLTAGDWQAAADILLKLNCWKHIRNAEAVKKMLLRKIQEAALRTYIFSYTAYYDSLSIEKLSLLFHLSQPVVHRFLSKMIIDGELHASHHQPTNSIVLHRVEPTRLQSLALQFADKISNLVEQNDKSTENRPYYTSSGFDPTRRSGQGKTRSGTGFRGSRGGGSRGNANANNNNNASTSSNRRGGSSYRRGGSSRGQRGSRGSRSGRRG